MAVSLGELNEARGVLGVAWNASEEEERQSYWRMARDNNPNTSRSGEFQKITEAYATLRRHRDAVAKVVNAARQSAAQAEKDFSKQERAKHRRSKWSDEPPPGADQTTLMLPDIGFSSTQTSETSWKSFRPAELSIVQEQAGPTIQRITSSMQKGGALYMKAHSYYCPRRCVFISTAPPGWTQARISPILAIFGEVVGVWVAAAMGFAMFKSADDAATATTQPLYIPAAPGSDKQITIQMQSLMSRADVLPQVERITPPPAVQSILDSEASRDAVYSGFPRRPGPDNVLHAALLAGRTAGGTAAPAGTAQAAAASAPAAAAAAPATAAAPPAAEPVGAPPAAAEAAAAPATTPKAAAPPPVAQPKRTAAPAVKMEPGTAATAVKMEPGQGLQAETQGGPATAMSGDAGFARGPPTRPWEFSKVTPCPHFLQSRCGYGMRCPMAHSLQEVYRARKSFRRQLSSGDGAHSHGRSRVGAVRRKRRRLRSRSTGSQPSDSESHNSSEWSGL